MSSSVGGCVKARNSGFLPRDICRCCAGCAALSWDRTLRVWWACAIEGTGRTAGPGVWPLRENTKVAQRSGRKGESRPQSAATCLGLGAGDRWPQGGIRTFPGRDMGGKIVTNDKIGRTFLCGECRVHVVICRRCDRGQEFCDACRGPRQRRLARARSRRYQRTERGRAKNAERQRRFRERRRLRVTHAGPPTPPSNRQPPQDLDRLSRRDESQRRDVKGRCALCRSALDRRVRLDFLPSKRSKKLPLFPCLSIESRPLTATRRAPE